MLPTNCISDQFMLPLGLLNQAVFIPGCSPRILRAFGMERTKLQLYLRAKQSHTCTHTHRRPSTERTEKAYPAAVWGNAWLTSWLTTINGFISSKILFTEGRSVKGVPFSGH